MTYCSHGINHGGERHGCDGCCKAASERDGAVEQAVMLKRERDEARAETERYRKRYEALAISDIHVSETDVILTVTPADAKKVEALIRERDDARADVERLRNAPLTRREWYQLGHRDGTRELQERIADLEAALRAVRPHITPTDIIDAALSPAPAQPATATKEDDVTIRVPPMTYCAHGVNHTGERHGCDGCCNAAPPSPAAREESREATGALEKELRLDMDEMQDELAEIRIRIRDEDRVETCLDNAGEIFERMRSRLDHMIGNNGDGPTGLMSGDLTAAESAALKTEIRKLTRVRLGISKNGMCESDRILDVADVISSNRKSVDRMGPLLAAANEVLNCADQDVGRFGIEVPADIAWKFAHAVRHAEGDMELLENCEQCKGGK